MKMGTGFLMDRHDVGAQSFHFGNELFRVFYHQVYVKWFLGLTGNGLHDRKAERDIGNEDPIHHIQMNPVAVTGIEHHDIAVQLTEIG